jgi:glutaminyl-tRNA synthetase
MTNANPSSNVPQVPHQANFLRHVIEHDLASGTFDGRTWAGQPGGAAFQAGGTPDAARVRLRFPPEPNGFLHIGHAKAICLNFGLAADYGGVCHLRLDDTNPDKEDTVYVEAIKDSVKWLGFDWHRNSGDNLYFASDCFEFMYEAAEALTRAGLAYVDERSQEEVRCTRGDFNHPGQDSPFRGRSPEENLKRLREMRDGLHAEGAMVLRAKVNMADANINMRDPSLYRIREAHHHRVGNRWHIYPMYTFAHPIEDALERITHSICTLEFEDQRPFYDWLLEHLADLGLLAKPLPKQYEFARLNLTYLVTSKRKLRQLVDDGHVSGWDDPRMPTIAGLRRRGYTPGSLRLLSERTGATKNNTWIDYEWLDIALRDDLEAFAPRAMAVLDPVPLKLLNWADVFGSASHLEPCAAPVNVHRPEAGKRVFELSEEVWIERSDFAETPPKGYQRLFPGNRVRLRYGLVVECVGCEKDESGEIAAVTANVVPNTKSGTPGADAVKVKGVVTWVGMSDGLDAAVNLYEHLFMTEHPGAAGGELIDELNPKSFRRVRARVEPSVAALPAGSSVQFERHGFFATDLVEHRLGAAVFNLTTPLRDTYRR